MTRTILLNNSLKKTWNEFLRPKHQCFNCGEEFKYKYNYLLHIKRCKGNE